MSNQALDEYLKENDIELLRSSVGDKNVIDLMRKVGSNLWRGTEWSHNILRLCKNW